MLFIPIDVKMINRSIMNECDLTNWFFQTKHSQYYWMGILKKGLLVSFLNLAGKCLKFFNYETRDVQNVSSKRKPKVRINVPYNADRKTRFIWTCSTKYIFLESFQNTKTPPKISPQFSPLRKAHLLWSSCWKLLLSPLPLSNFSTQFRKQSFLATLSNFCWSGMILEYPWGRLEASEFGAEHGLI